MPPGSSLTRWRCPQCTTRFLCTSTRRQAVGPEHPRYIDIPDPPQQTIPDRPVVKGVLPVPRNVFSGKSKNGSSEESIARSTKLPLQAKNPIKGSPEEWKAKMAAMRRQNLREGLESLHARQVDVKQRTSDRSAANQAVRHELLHRPARDDERFTTPSHNLDLSVLLKGSETDPTRRERLTLKSRNLANHQAAKEAGRQDALHTLYMNARDFIVTPQQLDEAVDKAFGTPENPIRFGGWDDTYGSLGSSSIWSQGRPMTVQAMLNKANRQGTRTALEGSSGHTETNRERMQRLAEALTGGKMDDTLR